MTRWTFRALGLLALSAGLALGQPAPKKDPAPKEPPKPAAGSLEDTLDKALRNSADIKVAEAKVRDAEAELDRVRQQVLVKGTMLHNELRVARKLLESLEAIYAQTREGYNKGTIPQVELLTSQMAFEKQKAEVEKREGELKALRGEFALHSHSNVLSVAFSPDGRRLATGTDGSIRIWDAQTGKALSTADAVWGHLQTDAKPAVQTTMADRLRKMLDKEVKWEGDGTETALADVMGLLGKMSGSDIPIRLTGLAVDVKYHNNLTGTLPLGALLQAIEDGAPHIRILVRDYGLLVTDEERAPEGAVRAVDFWKAKGEKPKAEKKEPEKK